MDQDKIGKLIKKLRSDNNLTQAAFAKKYNVTYQAVSKWENGKSLPDIALLKQICQDFNLNMEDLLEGQQTQKKHRNYWLIAGVSVFILLLFFIIFHFVLTTHEDFEFKTLAANCSNFNISGSIAYNTNKSSIYISHITYCGGDDTLKYRSINCTLYENNNNIKTKISNYSYEGNEAITLEEFLQDVTFKIDDYEKTCARYTEDTLNLEIDAETLSGELISYKIPLSLETDC